MHTENNILDLAKRAAVSGVALESARLCTVCWTVHGSEDCPECGARQWLYLAPLLRGYDEIDGASAVLRNNMVHDTIGQVM